MTTTTNTPTPTGLDLVIERLQALTAELQQQQAAAAAEPAAPLPVVLTAPEPELDHTALAMGLIEEVADAAAPRVAQLIDEQIRLWLRRRQLALPELQVPRADDVRDEIRQALVDSVGVAGEFTRAPRAQGSHRYRLF